MVELTKVSPAGISKSQPTSALQRSHMHDSVPESNPQVLTKRHSKSGQHCALHRIYAMRLQMPVLSELCQTIGTSSENIGAQGIRFN
jgi:hypothetical protein